MVFKVEETDSYVEVLLDDFNELMDKFGMEGRSLPVAPYRFVKRGLNFLCKPDWDKINSL